MAAKVLIIGPQRCGKTRIANFLADFETAPNFEAYNPTAGVRILECERVIRVEGRSVRQQVELWDCSGDKKYENCWVSILRDAHGVIMVYDPAQKTQEKDIELWHKAFVSGMNLPDSQVMLFSHSTDVLGGGGGGQPPLSLSKFTHLRTSLDNDDQTAAMRQTFDAFLAKVAVGMAEKSKAEMEASLNSASGA